MIEPPGDAQWFCCMHGLLGTCNYAIVKFHLDVEFSVRVLTALSGAICRLGAMQCCYILLLCAAASVLHAQAFVAPAAVHASTLRLQTPCARAQFAVLRVATDQTDFALPKEAAAAPHAVTTEQTAAQQALASYITEAAEVDCSETECLVDYEDTGAGELLLKAVSRGQDAAAATLDSFNPGIHFAIRSLYCNTAPSDHM
jgi:hypothetical protein